MSHPEELGMYVWYVCPEELKKVSKGCLHASVDSSVTYAIQKIEAPQLSFYGLIYKQNMMYTYHEICSALTRKESVTCCNVGGP